MSGIELVRKALAERITDAGIPVVQAWERARLPALSGVAAVIGVEETTSSDAGQWNYLGMSYDATQDQTMERYGRKLQLQLYIDLYAPKDQAEACGQSIEKLEELLLDPLYAGVRAQTVHCDALGVDSASGYLKCRCSAACTAYFTASRIDESAMLTDFELKGVVS